MVGSDDRDLRPRLILLVLRTKRGRGFSSTTGGTKGKSAIKEAGVVSPTRKGLTISDELSSNVEA